MTARAPQDRGSDARLVELLVADPPEPWAAAGFAVHDDRVRLGATTIRLTGRAADGSRGIRGWRLSGLDLGPSGFDGPGIDGLPTEAAPTEAADTADTAHHAAHPNGATALDHVVILTPDLERTIAAFGAIDLGVRRIRETTSYGAPMHQAFLRLGPTVIEVVSGDAGSGAPAEEAPATWFGLAVDVDDLDATAARLGPALGGIKDAVQEGRRIATFRHKDLGLSVAIAAMDDHAGRAGPPADAPG